MLKLLLNANLSPETARFLREEFEFDVTCLLEEGHGKLPDEAVAELARRDQRIIITSDLDFGQIYHFSRENPVGVIVLRLSDQTIENVNRKLKQFFDSHFQDDALTTELVVIDDTKYRFYSESNQTNE